MHVPVRGFAHLGGHWWLVVALVAVLLVLVWLSQRRR